jgi:hypothetical protein
MQIKEDINTEYLSMVILKSDYRHYSNGMNCRALHH